MRTTRVYFAGVVLGATLVGAAWLYTYQTWQTIQVFDPSGQAVASTRVRSQPWWAVYAAFGFALVGAGVSVWLLPEGRRFVNRVAARLAPRFVKPS